MKTRIFFAFLLLTWVGCVDFSPNTGMEVFQQDIGTGDVREDGVQNDPGTVRDGIETAVDVMDVANDPGATDIVYRDVAGDETGPTDVKTDTGHRDLGGEDVIHADSGHVDSVVVDVGPGEVFDGVEPHSRLFRLSTLHDQEPGIFYCPSPNSCMDVTRMINNMIDQYIAGQQGDQPVDILVLFNLTDSYNVTIGNGQCVRNEEGQVTGCDFLWSGDDQVTYTDVEYKGPHFSSLCMNKPQVTPACFDTDKQDASIAIPAMNMVLGLKDADLAAHFDGNTAFANKPIHGYLRGFMPVGWAKAVVIDYPGTFHGTLDQLLPRDKLTRHKGDKGWWFIFSFDAQPVQQLYLD